MEGTIITRAQNFKMSERAKWTDTLKKKLKDSPLASNLFFGLILVLLEKLVELEFKCPCDSKWNAAFACQFFILPGILSSALMMCIRGCKCEESMLQCCIPPIVWLALTFLDGQYFACAMTYWSGSYETFPQSSNLKWCKPDNTSDKTSEELQRMTQHWFSISQVIGMGCVGILTLVTGVYGVILCCKQNNQEERKDAAVEVRGNENQEMSGNADDQGIQITTF